MPLATKRDWLDTRPWIDQPGADVNVYVDGLSEDPGFDLRTQLENWQRDGIVVFRNAVDHALIDAYLADIEDLKAQHEDFELTVEVKAVCRPLAACTRSELESPGTKLNQMHTISGSAVRLSLNEVIIRFLGHIFRSAPCLLQSLTFSKGSQQPVHIDYPYVRTQTKLGHLAASWIPLEDIHPDSGPLAYYPGSHHIEASGFFDWGGGSILYEKDSARQPMEFSNYLKDRMQEVGIQPRVFLPKKGDVLIWHGNVAHEGSRIAEPSRTRMSYVTHYTSLEAYSPGHRFADALESGRYIRMNGGYSFDWPWLTNTRRLPSYQGVR